MKSFAVRRLLIVHLRYSETVASWVKSQLGTPAIYFSIATLGGVAICVILGTISFFVPPSMYSDSGKGFLAWRGTLLGCLNCILAPDSENISYDSVRFLNLWSPGQYIVPGVISLSGAQLGVAITITCALCFFLGLLGWIKVSQKFLPNSQAVIAIVFAVGLFRYSTLPFGIYNGEEV